MKTRIILTCHDSKYEMEPDAILYSDEPKEVIDEAMSFARGLIEIWLDDESEEEIPNEFDNCWCDLDFYLRALELRANAYYDDCDDEIVYHF